MEFKLFARNRCGLQNKENKKNSMAKTCLQRFEKILYIIGIIAAICGCNCLKKDFKVNFVTWIVVIAINCYFLCTLYTIYLGFIVNGDWMIILQAMSLAGSAIQGYTKLLCAINSKTVIYELSVELTNIYKEYQTDPDFLAVMTYRVDLTTKVLKFLVFIYMQLCGLVNCYPFVYGAIYNEKLLIMSFYLPYIDHTTDKGHIIHNVVHASLMALGSFGNFAADTYLFALIVHIPLLKDIIKVKCGKLSKVLDVENKPVNTMPLVKDILLWHQKYNLLGKRVEGAYNIVIFVQILTSVVSICCTIFCILINSWPAALVYLVYSFSMMYSYCGLGHLVEISNDEVTDVIYGDCLWYKLTIQEQKLVLLMLRKSQVPTSLTIGKVMPLSMSTALQLTKTIYSYTMMLANFLN